MENPPAAIPAAFLEVSETAAPLEVSSVEQRLVNLEQQVTYLSKRSEATDLVSKFSFPPGTTIGAIAEVMRANLRAGIPKEAIRIALRDFLTKELKMYQDLEEESFKLIIRRRSDK